MHQVAFHGLGKKIKSENNCVVYAHVSYVCAWLLLIVVSIRMRKFLLGESFAVKMIRGKTFALYTCT